MDDDEAALLAELRAISNKSAASRFADDMDDSAEPENRSPSNGERTVAHDEEGVSATPSVHEGEHVDTMGHDDDDDMVDENGDDDDILDELLGDDENIEQDENVEETEANPSALMGGGNFKQQSTFQGERGGAAEDADLLALLRGVSAKSSSADRFADDNDDNNNDYSTAAPVPAPKSSGNSQPSKAANSSTNRALPPWKRGKETTSKMSDSTANDDVVVVAKSTVAAAQLNVEEATPSEFLGGGGGNFKQQSTFQGERGGAAEDAELLALLRGVSAKSSSADRFADDNDDKNNDYSTAAPAPAPVSSRNSQPSKATNSGTSRALPPWKRGKETTPKVPDPTAHDDVVIVGVPKSTMAQPKAAEQVNVAESTPSEFLGGGGGNFKQQSTFQGERGGAAEDAELLALLRGVSAKSSSADRFADDNDGNNNDYGIAAPAAAPTPMSSRHAPPSKATNSSTSRALPPWKRGKETTPKMSEPTAPDDVVVVGVPKSTVAAPKAASQVDVEESSASEFLGGGGGNFKQQSTFQGERGGAAEDAELLALLRGVSAKSRSSDRFADDNDDNNNDYGIAAPAPTPMTSRDSQPSKTANSSTNRALPPWKRGKETTPKVSEPTAHDDVVVVGAPKSTLAAPKAPSQVNVEESTPSEFLGGGGGNFKQQSTFQGERGGAAEDAELLALLRGVSAKSSSADRFADDNDGNNNDYGIAVPAPAPVSSRNAPPSKATNSSTNRTLPPWKRGKGTTPKMSEPTAPDDIVVVGAPKSTVAAPNAASQENVEESSPSEFLGGGGGNFKQQSTFQGERGGAAEDAELLALLRGVSAKSSSSDRFADDNNNDYGIAAPAPAPVSSRNSQPSKATNSSTNRGLPPWKRGKETTPKMSEPTAPDDVVVVAKSTMAAPKAAEQVNVAESTPSDFLGGGGGNFKQQSTFQGERGGAAEDAELLALLRGVSAKASSADRFADENDYSGITKPRKEIPIEGVERMTQKALGGGGGNFKQESTFKGERGGTAEDEELLALLRGVSAKSSGTDRFVEGGEGTDRPLPNQTAPTRKESPPIASPQGEEDDIQVTRDQLPDYINHSNWKVRRNSYVLLQSLILEESNGALPSNTILGDAILPGLDGKIAGFLMDKNATAIEEALQVALLYADYCIGGQSAALAETMVNNLIKGNGFTSPRPKASKIAQELVLKLMEVGNDTESLNVVIGVLLTQGLSSKKPKIVQMATTLILEATQAFGAGSLPLAAIKQSLPKMLAHSNKKIRDDGLEIVAELCRALGGKSALQDLLDQMKKPQIKDLDVLLQQQPHSTEIKIGLRSRKANGGSAIASPDDALAALNAGAAELAAERYAKRAAVNLPDEVRKSDYAQHLKLSKWSEKVTGLNIILACGGEKPFKLMQPSASVSYAPLISEMKGVLSHTHFAVVSKALEVLSMLADGVGEKLYPNLRPLLPLFFALAKDKKLTNAVSSCLDSFFGNVLSFEHVLDADAAIPEATDERKEKNALARSTALDFLERCVARRDKAGTRGVMGALDAKNVSRLAVEKLGDSDASVRKSALNILSTLQKVDDPDCQRVVQSVIADLESSNPRAYKQLGSVPVPPKKVAIPHPSPAASPAKAKPKELPSASAKASTRPPPASTKSVPVDSISSASMNSSLRPSSVTPFPSDSAEAATITLEQATTYVGSMGIPLWDAIDEDGGVLAGLISPKWQSRQDAIKLIATFVNEKDLPPSPEALQSDSSHILVLVKEHTRGFKETNVNVSKSIMELFLALCDCHEKMSCPLPTWAGREMAILACSKISDKKLSPLSKSLLMSACVVQSPQVIMSQSFASMSQVKSPVAHEEFLHWMLAFSNEFGAAAIGPGLKETVVFVTEHCDSKNIKVKKAALAVMGAFHIQLGTPLEAIVTATIKDISLRDQLQKTFSEHPHDPTVAASSWPKFSILGAKRQADGNQKSADGLFLVDIPKFDLFSELPADLLTRMSSKDGKTSWKARKDAMEELDACLQRCAGLIDTSKLKPLVDLLRALRERLSDSQSNLKPVAARLIGIIMSLSDATAQAKLGKVVYGPLINSAMNDSRKIMHDACMEALVSGTSLPKLEGTGPNDLSLEVFIVSLVGELDESDFKSGGISDVLDLSRSFANRLGDLDSVASQGGNTVGARLAKVLVQGLSSSKAEIRASAEALLGDCVKNNVLGIATVKKIAGRQKPAVQRAIAPIVTKLSATTSAPPLPPPVEDDDICQDAESVSSIPRGAKTPVRSSIAKTEVPSATLVRTSESNNQDIPRSPRRNTSVSNPLVASVGTAYTQKSRAALKSMTWPEYPEEPSGSLVLNALKRAWSPLIPMDSTKQLFPDEGIKKQDDAMAGFDLLSRAIAMESAGEGCAIVEQFNFIWKWMTYVLCCKESTVGLQSLLQLASDLVDHIRSLNYELSDSEAMTFVPHLFDKASTAKGRFKDSFFDLIEKMKKDDLLPAKRLGPLVCVGVIEGSSHPKARLLACKECQDCVEKIGLSGVGKRGVLVAAKALSDEKLQENRNALVDLMVLLVSRMNGDMQRFIRICGSALSGKARSLVEEQIQKGTTSTSSSGGKAITVQPSPPPKSIVHSQPGKATPSRLPSLRSKPQATIQPNETEKHSDDGFKDELPALNLRYSSRGTPSFLPRQATSESPQVVSSSKIKGSPPARLSPNDDEIVRDLDEILGASNPDNDVRSEEVKDSPKSVHISAGSNDTIESNHSESLGAAASLRARLMKIREKNKNGAVSSFENKQSDELTTSRSDGSEAEVAADENAEIQALRGTWEMSQPPADFDKVVHQPSKSYLIAFIAKISQLLARSLPLPEEDDEILECTDVLKSIHAAVSQQPSLAVNLVPDDVAHLRDEIKERANDVVEILTRLIAFGFKCHDSDCNGGMSVPLLSVDLASLMAIFRSDDIAKAVRVEDLTVLIKEAGKALLDPRLAASSQYNALDEATSTQMVRAINKLAVQAATGSTRHFAFEALIALQQQLCLKADGLEDPLFNSRLSRVITKLFARVVKAEEASPSPFSPATVDMEAVICFLEDTLVACEDANNGEIGEDAITSTINLPKVLVTAILKARREAMTFRRQMEELEISPHSSSLGRLVASCASELELPDSPYTENQGSVKDVAALVSAVAEAPLGSERDAAVAALQEYKMNHGDEDLNNHLKEVSAAFRAFILEQLSQASRPETQQEASTNVMSERIKSLRSKLRNATENSTDQTGEAVALPKEISSVDHSGANAAPSASVRAFRERLAAAHEKRTSSELATNRETTEPTGTAGSRAAALRARLQAVKRQTEQTEY